MGLSVSADAQLVFFNKVFGPSHPVTVKAKNLIQNGLKLEVTLYSLRAYLNQAAVGSVKLTYGTNALIKHGEGGVQVPSSILLQNKALIDGFVSGLHEKHGTFQQGTVPVLLMGTGLHASQPNLILLIKAIRTITGEPLGTAKTKAEKIIAGENVFLGNYPIPDAQAAVKTFQALGVTAELANVAPKPVVEKPVVEKSSVEAPQPVNAVILLKDAKALGQKVKGTSHSSVYHTIVYTEHVKLAARVTPGGSISIRAEWTDSPQDDLKRLQAAGLELKEHYGSIHFSADGVQPSRVIGAFLFGTGIHWKAALTSGADVVIGGSL